MYGVAWSVLPILSIPMFLVRWGLHMYVCMHACMYVFMCILLPHEASCFGFPLERGVSWSGPPHELWSNYLACEIVRGRCISFFMASCKDGTPAIFFWGGFARIGPNHFVFCVFVLHAPFQWELFLQCCWSTWIVGSWFQCRIIMIFEPSYVNICFHANWPGLLIIISIISSCRWCSCGARKKHVFVVLSSFCWFNVVLQYVGPFDKNKKQLYIICGCFRFLNFDLTSVFQSLFLILHIYGVKYNVVFVCLSILKLIVLFVSKLHWFWMHFLNLQLKATCAGKQKRLVLVNFALFSQWHGGVLKLKM